MLAFFVVSTMSKRGIPTSTIYIKSLWARIETGVGKLSELAFTSFDTISQHLGCVCCV